MLTAIFLAFSIFTVGSFTTIEAPLDSSSFNLPYCASGWSCSAPETDEE